MSEVIHLNRKQEFDRILDFIRKGDMPDVTGWEFNWMQIAEIQDAINSLKDKPGYDEKEWNRYYLGNIEFRKR